MTREEAIEVLKKNRPGADPRRCGLELCTAVDVAIAALREQGGSFQNGNDHNTVKDWPSYMDLPRKQEERSKGCSACEMTTRGLTYKQIEYGTLRGDFINDSSGMYIIRYGGGQHSIVCDDDGTEIDIEFCPMCGRRLEDT